MSSNSARCLHSIPANLRGGKRLYELLSPAVDKVLVARATICREIAWRSQDMVEIDLDEKEHSTFLEILKSARSELSYEIANTDSYDF